MNDTHAHHAFLDLCEEAGIGTTAGRSLMFRHAGREFVVQLTLLDVTDWEDS